MSRATKTTTTEGSPDRKPKSLKQRGELLRLPKGHSDVKSEYSSETAKPSGPNVQYENTYKMRPDEDHRFVAYKIEHAMKDILSAALKDEKYSAESCKKQAETLCDAIKKKAKEFAFHRYKLVVQVLIGEDTDQTVQMASRCLWDHSSDNFAAATYRNTSLYAIATVYGLYME